MNFRSMCRFESQHKFDNDVCRTDPLPPAMDNITLVENIIHTSDVDQDVSHQDQPPPPPPTSVGATFQSNHVTITSGLLPFVWSRWH